MSKILIADDESAVRDVMTQMLKGMGHDVVAVANGRLALEAMTRQSFDAVITDLDMPVMDGLTLIRRIRETDQSLSILVISGKSGANQNMRSQSVGANAWLEKPFTYQSLHTQMRKLLTPE